MFGMEKRAAIVLGVLVLAMLLALGMAVRSCTTSRTSSAAVKAQQVNDTAKDQAAVERRSDDARIAADQQERNDAIDAAPAGATGPATRALNCERWMRAHPGADRPAGC